MPANLFRADGIFSRKLVAAVSLSLLVGAAGCSYLPSVDTGKKVDYRSATKAPALEVPPDLTSPNFDEKYVVPDGAPGSATFSSAMGKDAKAAQPAAQTGLLPSTDKARLERAGSQRWLVVKATPEATWNASREFWQQAGFTLLVDRPELGIMETDWAENRAKIPHDIVRATIGKVFDFLYSTSERDKFRTRIERGSEPGTTEIYISHRGMVEVSDVPNSAQAGVFRWQPRPSDPELEAEMLRRLLIKIGLPEQQAQTVVAVSEPAKVPGVTAGSSVPAGSGDQAKIERGSDGISRLTVADAFDRSWRRVGLALDRVGFTVVDRDRSKGTYFVRYADADAVGGKKDDGGGFWSKMAFWKSDDSKEKPEQYRILVVDRGTTTTVEVQDSQGTAEKSELAVKMLGLLQAQLK